jgi:hypothetical protein
MNRTAPSLQRNPIVPPRGAPRSRGAVGFRHGGLRLGIRTAKSA